MDVAWTFLSAALPFWWICVPTVYRIHAIPVELPSRCDLAGMLKSLLVLLQRK